MEEHVNDFLQSQRIQVLLDNNQEMLFWGTMCPLCAVFFLSLLGAEGDLCKDIITMR